MMTFFNSVLYNNIHILFALIFIKNIFLNSIPSKYKIILKIYFFLNSIHLQCIIRSLFFKIIYMKYM
jgi:hypothetical protein